MSDTSPLGLARETHSVGYGIVGYPASGKSEAGEMLASDLPGIHHETGWSEVKP